MGTFTVDHPLESAEVRRRLAATFAELEETAGVTYALDPARPVITFQGSHPFAGRITGRVAWDGQCVTVEVGADRLEGTVEAKVREAVAAALGVALE